MNLWFGFAVLAAAAVRPVSGRCGALGSPCQTRSRIRCPSQQGICKTHGGCVIRSQCSSSFDQKDFFDDCVCDPDAHQRLSGNSGTSSNDNDEKELETSAIGSQSSSEPKYDPDSSCGGLGRICTLDRGCNGQKGICKTHSGCTDRSKCSGSSFDREGFFDECICTPPGDEPVAGVPGMVFVAVATLLGLAIYYAAVVWMQPQVPKYVHLPLGLGAFYSVFSFGFTMLVDVVGMSTDDFFTSGAFSFIIIILAMGTVIGGGYGCIQLGLRNTVAMLIGSFCAMAGFFSFTLSIVLLGILGAVLFALMTLVIRCLRSSWRIDEAGDVEQGQAPEEAGAGEHAKEACRSAYSLSLAAGLVQQFTGFFMRLVNFVLQVALLSFAIGDVQGVKEEVKMQFQWSFDLSLRVPDLPALCGWLSEEAAVLSTFMSDAAEELADFMLDYTNIWTPNKIIAYTSVGVFEMFVVAAVFGIVLSDCLLILSPREGSGRIATLVVDLVSRAMLYTLQGLVSASNTLLLALLWVRPIERPELSSSQKFFNKQTEQIGTPLTLFYVGLVLLMSSYILCQLWSGVDAGLQNVATRLLKMQGIHINEVTAGRPSPFAFLSAFLGVWPQHVLDAFEVEQRMRNFRLETDEVMLATVNALSFPLYIVPFGGLVAKLGEYMNQSPIYVAGRGFRWSSLFMSLSYFVEYVLVLVACGELLSSSERGTPDAQEVATADSEDDEEADDGILATLGCFIVLALARAVIAGVRGHLSRYPTRVSPSAAAVESRAGKEQSLDQPVVSSASNKVEHCPMENNYVNEEREETESTKSATSELSVISVLPSNCVQ